MGICGYGEKSKKIRKQPSKNIDKINDLNPNNNENEEILKINEKEEQEKKEREEREKKEREEQEKKEKEEQEKIESEISEHNKLYNLYYAAKEYFRFNDLKEQEVDAINKCRVIKEYIKILETNPNIENIEEYKKKIPDKLIPEYICGYSREEKINKCKEIELNLLSQKEMIDEEINEFRKKCSKLSKEKLEKMKNGIALKLKQKNSEKNKIDEYVKVLSDITKNEWTPLPDIMKIEKTKKIEIINYDIPERVLKIQVNKINYTKSNPVLKLGIQTEKSNKYKEIQIKNYAEINETFEWEFSEEDWKTLCSNNLCIILERSYTVNKNKLKGKGQINLKKLSHEFSIEGKFLLKMESGKEDKVVELSINVRTPIITKKYDEVTYEAYKITNIYPAFQYEIYSGDEKEVEDKVKITKSQISVVMDEINEVLNNNALKKSRLS